MTRPPNIRVARIYDAVETTVGTRVLVDRLWPRGISKERAAVDVWLKEVAPSAALRTWYGHDPDRFDEFARRYRAELTDTDHADALAELHQLAADGPVTLLTASKRDDISQATVLHRLLTQPNE